MQNDASEDKAAVKIRGKRKEKRNKKVPVKRAWPLPSRKGWMFYKDGVIVACSPLAVKAKNERKGEVTDENDCGIGDGTDGDFCSPGAGQISQLYSGTKNL